MMCNTNNKPIKTRFAPSPTGFMHIGNLRTCLYGYMFAKRNGGKFLLRIEDTDTERYVEGAVDAILRTLDAANIIYDEGPGKDRGQGPYVQSERKAIYKEYAEKLVAAGGAYYCFCDEERLSSLADEKGVKRYDKHCLNLPKEEAARRIANGEKYVIRQNIPKGAVCEYEDAVYGKISVPDYELEDGILLKSDGMPTYNFANVIDDRLMGITHVIRGNEYLSSTPKYNLIYDAFGWERPSYAHLAPIMRDEQHKLSKRHGDANFEDFIAKGFLPEAIINYIALLGWSPGDNTEKMTLAEMTEKFSLDGVGKSGSIFDEKKMRWLNGEYLKEKTDEEFLKIAALWFDRAGMAGKFDYQILAKLLKTRVEILSEIPEKLEFLNNFTPPESADKILEGAYKVLSNIPEAEWNNEILKASIEKIAEDAGIKTKLIFNPLRLAITGVKVTPGGATEMAELLGKEETLRRLTQSLKNITR